MSEAAATRRVPSRRPHATDPVSPEPWLAMALRMVVHAVTAAALVWPLAHTGAVAAAAIGASLGSACGRLMARTRVRLLAIEAGVVVALAATVGARELWVGVIPLPSLLGPAAAMRVADAWLFGAGAVWVTAGLRALSSRRPALAVLEVAAVAIAFAQLVVAHRHGAINRPFAIADPILAAGGDPTMAFLGIGAVATVVLVLLLLRERSVVRSLLHVAVAIGVVLLVIAGTRTFGLPPPPPSGKGLGLRGDSEDESQRRDRGRRGEQGDRGGRQRDNEQLEFRNNYDSSGSQTPVGVVVFHDDYSPPHGVYYFRQSAFSQYNGRRLVHATRDDVDRDIASGFPTEPRRLPVTPPDSARRMSVEQTVALLADHTRPFALAAPVRLAPATNPDPGRFKRTYRAVSRVRTSGYRSLIGSTAGAAAWSDAQWNHYTDAPDDSRYAELAQRIVEQKLPARHRDDPVARALAITSWLGEHGAYDLQSSHADAEDPTAHFLFGNKTGYCVHFAHAASYLMRTLGLPTRVATGYAVDEAARRGGSALLLSGRNSHAWPEVYLGSEGWVPFDITPEQVLTPPPEPPDPDLQRLLGELARGNDPLPQQAAPALPRLARAARDLGGLVGRIGGLALAIGLVLLFGIKLWRRIAPRLVSSRALPRVQYRAEADRLGEVALRRMRGESRESFAARVRAQVPSFDALTQRHVTSAFGRRAEVDRGELERTARAVREERRRAFPWWRRVVGALTPWSWMRTR